MAYFSKYFFSESKRTYYFINEEIKKKQAYFLTTSYKSSYFFTEEFKKKHAYFFTPAYKTAYLVTEEFKKITKFFFTPFLKTAYFFSEGFDPTLDIDPDNEDTKNTCIYSTELDRIRNKATLLYYAEVEKCLKSSISKESYGKISTGGFNKAGMLRILLDYLSSIWVEKDQDSRSGVIRLSDYYYTKYAINDVIITFRECGLNVKSLVALFNLNSYSIIDNEWPNYFLINNIINPPTDEALKTLKQHTDIFTLNVLINPDSNQTKYPIVNNQTGFPLTKIMKYLTSFQINGSDYIAYTDYNTTTVTYSPSILFGYTISNADTVTITYWYEE